jgi:uncharacterized membrane protein YecN with MAPEG domain
MLGYLEFIAHYPSCDGYYYQFVNNDYKRHNYEYTIGLHENKEFLTELFPLKTLSFTTLENVHWDIRFGPNIAKIKIAKDAKFMLDYGGQKQFTTNKFEVVAYMEPDNEIYRRAIMHVQDALKYLPGTLVTKETCNMAVSSNGITLRYVPDEFKTVELYEMAIRQNGNAIFYVPDKFITYEMCKIAVNNTPSALIDIPAKYRDDHICLIAVQQNGEMLEYVPPSLRNIYICIAAIQQNGLSLEYVPIELISEELCEMAIKQCPYAVKYVPIQLKTAKLYELAIQYIDNSNITINSPFISRCKEMIDTLSKN